MKIYSSTKRGLVGGLLTAVLYLVNKERSKDRGCSPADANSWPKRCMDITDKNMGELNKRGWIVLMDTRRRPEHIRLAKIASRLANFATLYPDTLRKAELAAKLNFNACGQLVAIGRIACTEMKLMDVVDVYLLGRILYWREELYDLFGVNPLFEMRIIQLVLMLLEKLCRCSM
jgi:hypothetical protein